MRKVLKTFFIGIIALIILGIIVANMGSEETATSPANGNEETTQADSTEKETEKQEEGAEITTEEDAADTRDNVALIVDAVQFAGLSESELIELIGDPESKNQWNFDSANGQTYKAVTLTYDNGNQEFLFIDGKVVRFTFYGTGQTYENEDQALRLFGITPGPNIKKEADTGVALRYRYVDEEMKIDEFWLLDDLSNDNEISTVKITYDLRYFE